MGMIERTFTCPIVYEVMEELKNSLGFLRAGSQPPSRVEEERTGTSATCRTQNGKGTPS